MRRFTVFFLLLFFVVNSDAQQKYKCEFFDTTILVIPEPLFRDLASKNNLSSKQIKQFLEQQRTRPPYRYQLRVARADEGQTIVNLDKHSIKGNFIVQTVGKFRLERLIACCTRTLIAFSIRTMKYSTRHQLQVGLPTSHGIALNGNTEALAKNSLFSVINVMNSLT